MNFIAYYMNSSGYPKFTFVFADNRKEAKNQFKQFHPDDELISLYVNCNEVVYALAHMF